jgi:hypothetical protein
MKKLFTIATLTLLITACSKTSEPVDTNPLHGKWNFKDAGHSWFNPVKPGDYLDFNADGKAYRKYINVLDTSYYTRIGDTIKMNKGKYVNNNLVYSDIFFVRKQTKDTLVILDVIGYNNFINRLVTTFNVYTLNK